MYQLQLPASPREIYIALYTMYTQMHLNTHKCIHTQLMDYTHVLASVFELMAARYCNNGLSGVKS